MGYGQPPWEFRGQALYQLSLVKVEEARKYVPPELPIVNFFGWTLGGFYLARYTHSPVGAFDEVVALAALAWNFPTSCAWAARVFVNNKAARDHGIHHVGLPSRLASFKAVPLPKLVGGGESSKDSTNNNNTNKKKKRRWWWDTDTSNNNKPTLAVELGNIDSCKSKSLKSPLCTFEMPEVKDTWAPQIIMHLPSYSGGTPEHPSLISYDLKLQTRVKFTRPVKVTFPENRPRGDCESTEVLDAVLGGRPLLCMSFEDMVMDVQAPEPFVPKLPPWKKQPEVVVAPRLA